jgi:hypothetical protein
MSRPRTLLLVLSIACWTLSLTHARAQDIPADDVGDRAAAVESAVERLHAVPDDGQGLTFAVPAQARSTPRSRLLWSLYGTTIFTQALDVHSTRTAIAAGGREANPLVRGLADRTLPLVAVKTGMAVVTIMAARRMARHNKVVAIAALVAINAGYAVVIKRNYDVARRGR